MKTAELEETTVEGTEATEAPEQALNGPRKPRRAAAELTRFVGLKCQQTLFDAVQEACEREHLSFSDYFRIAVENALGNGIKDGRVSKDQLDGVQKGLSLMARELGAVGNLINQIALVYNLARKQIGLTADPKERIKLVERMIDDSNKQQADLDEIRGELIRIKEGVANLAKPFGGAR